MCSWDDPPWLAERELEIFPLVSALRLASPFTAAELTVNTELYHSSHPLNSVDPSCFFSGGGKSISGINNPLKCHQIPRSPRELRPRAVGTGMLTLGIKQHFISYYGVTTTSCNRRSQKCHSQTASYEAYHIDIIYSRSQPDSTSSPALCQPHNFRLLCECYSDADTKAPGSECLWFKAKPLLRNLLAHLMRPWQNGGAFSLLSYSLLSVFPLPTCRTV